MAKTASLTAGLVAKKGEAAPATVVRSAQSAEVSAAGAGAGAGGSGRDYYKALTVKLDRDRYETLKNVGVKLDKKSQEIFVEALDLWLKQATAQSA